MDVVGNVCESGDVFARARRLPYPEVGDLLAIRDAGAYGMAMASTYNTRPLPAEVVIDGDEVRLARKRQTISELLDQSLW
jgi:diaminopimelate decarboxylase